MPLGLQGHKIPTPGQPSEPESGSSLGPDAFSQGKADRLDPTGLDSSTHHSCAGGMAVPAKSSKEPCVQLLLQMLHPDCNPQVPSDPALDQSPGSDQARLTSSPWVLQLGSCRPLWSHERHPMAFLVSDLGSFCSDPSRLPLLYSK